MTTRYLTIADAIDPTHLNNQITAGPADEKRILIEGDSWAAYPLPSTGNLSHYIKVPDENCVSLNLAWIGDRISQISQGQEFELFKRMINNQWGQYWDVIVLIAGGNDLIGWIFNAAVVNPASGSLDPEDYLDQSILEEKINTLKNYYRRYINARNASDTNQNTPIVVQTYDYVTPRDHPPSFLGITVKSKPWIYPQFIVRGITDPGVQDGVVRRLIDALSMMLIGLGSEPGSNFHVVDTRNVLTKVDASYRSIDGDWQDEMHPSAVGYEKLAARINERIGQLV